MMIFKKHTGKKPRWPYQPNTDSVLYQSLIGWWPVVHGKGNVTIPDNSKYQNNMTLSGTNPGLAYSGGLEGGLAFKAEGSTLVGTATIPQIVGLTSASFGCWIYRTASGTYNTFGLNSIAAATRYNIQWYTDNKMYMSAGGYVLTSNGAFANTGWNRLDFNFNGGAQGQIYLNGVLVPATGIGSPPASITGTNISTYWLGKDYTNGFGTGIYDEPVVYSRARKPAEIFASFDPTRRWDLRAQDTNKSFYFPAAINKNQGIIGAFNRRIVGA